LSHIGLWHNLPFSDPVWLYAFAVTGAPGQRGGAAGSVRLKTRRAPPSGDRVGVGLDQERGDLERPGSHGRRADSPDAGGDYWKRVPAPVGDTAVMAMVALHLQNALALYMYRFCYDVSGKQKERYA
jgi:hypothetical protein